MVAPSETPSFKPLRMGFINQTLSKAPLPLTLLQACALAFPPTCKAALPQAPSRSARRVLTHSHGSDTSHVGSKGHCE